MTIQQQTIDIIIDIIERYMQYILVDWSAFYWDLKNNIIPCNLYRVATGS